MQLEIALNLACAFSGLVWVWLAVLRPHLRLPNVARRQPFAGRSVPLVPLRGASDPVAWSPILCPPHWGKSCSWRWQDPRDRLRSGTRWESRDRQSCKALSLVMSIRPSYWSSLSTNQRRGRTDAKIHDSSINDNNISVSIIRALDLGCQRERICTRSR